jgi:spore coat polysaccharide biosynthesis protein SpsF
MATEAVAAIVQARMGSTRFPGKSLAPFGRSTILQHMLSRLRPASNAFTVWVATTENPEDDAIVAACESEGVPVHRGSAEDVLARFAGCVRAMPERPELVVRICADRPLLGPELVDELLDAYVEIGEPDYLANNLPPSYPDGLDVELVRTDVLEQAERESADAYEREHVTPFVYRRPERFSLRGLVCPYGNHHHVRAALDTPADHERLVRAHAELAAHDEQYDHRDILTLAALRPDLF